MDTQRLEHLIRFYSILDGLEHSIGGPHKLADCSGRMNWPSRGVYFFREASELRSDSGRGPRVVRVGTHALRTGGRTKLWTRLSQHKGQVASGGDNHRGSIFRLIVGAALIRRDGLIFPTWGNGSTAESFVRSGEVALERQVSRLIGDMPFLWVPIGDEPGPKSRRGYIERNAIALLSNYNKPPLDPPSQEWLGRHCEREQVSESVRDRVMKSGLWNSDYVDAAYDPAFLNELGAFVSAIGRVS
jgi:hypothetical protein